MRRGIGGSLQTELIGDGDEGKRRIKIQLYINRPCWLLELIPRWTDIGPGNPAFFVSIFHVAASGISFQGGYPPYETLLRQIYHSGVWHARRSQCDC